MDDKAINLKEKFTKFSKHWSPRVVAEMNDYQFKLAKLKDDFVWHDHKDTDEVFLVVHGSMSIEFEDKTVDLNEGDTIIKYGHDIGKVVKAIKKGEHVHVHNVKTKKW